MFDALMKWNLDLNDIEGITTGKPSEQGVKIKLAKKQCTIFFGPASFIFTKEDADWSTSEETPFRCTSNRRRRPILSCSIRFFRES
jgi:hypothetical protein